MKTFWALVVGVFVGLGAQLAWATITIASGNSASVNGIVEVNQSSGTDAFKVLTNGARVHFGTGANDYCSSDGTTVTYAGALASSNYKSQASTLWIAEEFGCSGTCFDFLTDTALGNGTVIAQFSNNFTPAVTMAVNAAGGADVAASSGNFFGVGAGNNNTGVASGSFALFGSVSPTGDLGGTVCDVVETSTNTRDAGCIFGVANKGDDQWFVNYQGGMEPLNKWTLAGFGACGDTSHRDGTLQHPNDTFGTPWYQCQALSDGGTYTDGGGWVPVVTATGVPSYVAPATFGAYYDGQAIGAGDVVSENRFGYIVTGVSLSFTATKAGADGAHNFTVDVYDKTQNTVLCVTGNIACNVAAGTVTRVACSTASTVSTDDIDLRVNDSTCVTVSLGNASWVYR